MFTYHVFRYVHIQYTFNCGVLGIQLYTRLYQHAALKTNCLVMIERFSFQVPFLFFLLFAYIKHFDSD